MTSIPIPQLIQLQSPIISDDLAADSSEDLWAEFGQLKITDSTRKQYVKATAEAARKLREFMSVCL